MWSVAQYIEGKRHRKTLTKFMADIFAAPARPNAFQRWLGGLPLTLMVDSWYDGAIAAAMRNPGLALVIATVNNTPPAVTAAVIGYALGLGLTIVAFLQWRKRRSGSLAAPA